MSKEDGGPQQGLLRSLPSVDEVLGWKAVRGLAQSHPRSVLVECVRGVLQDRRQEILQGRDPGRLDEEGLIPRVAETLRVRSSPSLLRIINATGVVLHTNLGRAPLARQAVERACAVALSYSNLEYDLQEGARGDRQLHLSPLLRELTGAEASLVVNNNAAALLLILNSLAEGREVIVSRGELVEIGGSFRLPEIMRKGGALLREVGTTNKTYPSDYEQAIHPHTALLLKVHTSNFRQLGFIASCSVADLVRLGRQHQVPVVEDLGSGALVDLSPYGLPKEPLVQESLEAGADLICFSGDKLLGGPQAGVILGRRDLVERVAKNPLARAMRLDKMSLVCLEETLRIYQQGAEVARSKIPVLCSLTNPREVLARRAQRLLELLTPALREAYAPQVAGGEAEAGGGSLPGISIPTWCVTLQPSFLSVQKLEAGLRRGHPPILGRIRKGSLLLDMRTLTDEEVEQVALRLAQLARAPEGLSEREEAEGIF